MKHQVDIVISSSGFNTLLDNQPPEYRNQWQMHISVRRQGGLYMNRFWIATILFMLNFIKTLQLYIQEIKHGVPPFCCCCSHQFIGRIMKIRLKTMIHPHCENTTRCLSWIKIWGTKFSLGRKSQDCFVFSSTFLISTRHRRFILRTHQTNLHKIKVQTILQSMRKSKVAPNAPVGGITTDDYRLRIQLLRVRILE